MDRTDLKLDVKTEAIDTRVVAPYQSPDLEQLNRELDPHNLSLSAELRRLIENAAPLSPVQRFLKRIFDFSAALLALVIFSPLFLLLGALILLDSRGPVFYAQTRVGKRGRLFKLHKFRSMIPEADALKEALKDQNEVDGPAFKMKNDPRVTRLGRFLRKSSLDELPQLWNVVRGDMSLVGPRPALPSEVSEWESWQYQRLAVEQGCTCIWQVSGRNDTNFHQWMQMDLQYVRSWSLILDIILIIRTILVMLTGRGAY